MLIRLRLFVLFCFLSSVSFLAQAQEQFKFKADLDPLLTLPGAWSITPDKLDEMFKHKQMKRNPYFKWLTTDRTRAIFQRQPFSNVTINLTIFDSVPIEEAILDFRDGKFLGATISIYNRGDGSEISRSDFDARFKTCGTAIGNRLGGASPFRRKANPTQGLLTEGWIWLTRTGMAVLESNPQEDSKIEFMRMRFARRDAGGAYEAAMKDRAGASVRLSDLPRNVKRDSEGNVFVDKLPMVDQGQKGYCVVASAQRIFEYYGIPCDMHQLAQIAGSDPERGTSSLAINQELGAIDHRFKTRFSCIAVGHRGKLVELEDDRYVGDDVTEKDYMKSIRKSIDSGIPLLWALELGRYTETPAISQQANGGHMRIIIGYNDKTGRIIFSDSWGAGHEFKTMAAGDSYSATTGLFLLKPTTR